MRGSTARIFDQEVQVVVRSRLFTHQRVLAQPPPTQTGMEAASRQSISSLTFSPVTRHSGEYALETRARGVVAGSGSSSGTVRSIALPGSARRAGAVDDVGGSTVQAPTCGTRRSCPSAPAIGCPCQAGDGVNTIEDVAIAAAPNSAHSWCTRGVPLADF